MGLKVEKVLVKLRKGGFVRTGMEGAEGSQMYSVIGLLLKRKEVCL